MTRNATDRKSLGATREFRVVLSEPLHRQMVIYQTLLGETPQGFVQSAIIRYLEALGSLRLVLPGPGDKTQGVRIVTGGDDTTLRSLKDPPPRDDA